MRVDDAPASVRRHRSSGSHQGMRQATLLHIPPGPCIPATNSTARQCRYEMSYSHAWRNGVRARPPPAPSLPQARQRLLFKSDPTYNPHLTPHSHPHPCENASRHLKLHLLQNPHLLQNLHLLHTQIHHPCNERPLAGVTSDDESESSYSDFCGWRVGSRAVEVTSHDTER